MTPEGWKNRKISELLEGTALPVSVEPQAIYREIGIRSHAKGIFHKGAVTGATLGDKRVFHVVPDCFVVNIVFAWEQAVARTSNEEVGMIASHRFPMFKPRNGACDIDYILYLFKSPKGKYLLGLASPGGAGRNKTLGKAEFTRLEILVPHVTEQKKIAKILTTWDLAITTTEQLIGNSQLEKKALMQQLMTGKKRLTGFAQEWKNCKLSDVAKIIVSPVDKKTEPNEIAVRLCNYKDVYYNNCITKKIEFMRATATKSEIEKYTIKIGDVLITKDSETPGDIAIPAFVNEDLDGVVCGYHLAIIRPDNRNACGEYINHLFSMQKTRYYFFTLATGATRFGLSVGGIHKASFWLPPIEEQQKIAEILSAANCEIETLQAKLSCLKQEKKALMQQLLTGKRRVNTNEVEVA